MNTGMFARLAAAGLAAFCAPAQDDARARNEALSRMVREKAAGLPDALSRGLEDPDPGVRQIALSNLELVGGDQRLVDALGRRLEREPAATRWLVIRAIASIPAALVAFANQAPGWAEGPDPLVRRALLANIQDGPEARKVAIPVLLKALADGGAGERMAAAQSLARLKAFAGGEPTPVWRPALERLLSGLASPEESVAGAASYALLALWNSDIGGRLEKALQSPDLLLRARAADLFRKKKRPFDVAVLAPVFARGSELAQLHACGTLSRVQAPPSVPVLEAALRSRHAPVRQCAVYALESVGAAPAAQSLIRALRHTDPNVRYRAAAVLGRMREPLAAEALRRAAQADSEPRVTGAARIAAALAGGRTLDAVLPQLGEVVSGADARPVRTIRPAAGGRAAMERGAVRIGGWKQLFADDLVVADLGGAVRRVHKFRKDPRNPLLEQSLPWELQGTLSFSTTVDYDPDLRLFRMWYTSYWRIPAFRNDERGFTKERNRAQLIAYSADGIEWVRPNLGRYDFEGSKANNMVESARNMMRLPASGDPAKRYATFNMMRQDGRYFLAVTYSPDGITPSGPPVRAADAGGDVGTLTYDSLGGGIFGFNKWSTTWWLGRSFGVGYDFGRRALLKQPSNGFRSFAPVWGRTPGDLVTGDVNVYPAPEDDSAALEEVAARWPNLDFVSPADTHSEVYQVVPFPYEGHYFGFPVVFYSSGRGGANEDGPTRLSMIVSRDPYGKTGWSRPAGRLAAVLDNGRWGEWDSGQIYGPTSLLVADDEIVLYYTAMNHGHEPEGSKSDGEGNRAYRTAIGRATLRLDGMVSLEASQREAVIRTRPLLFDGGTLVVNARCPDGSLGVELEDERGNRFQSLPFRGDSVRHAVEWRTPPPLAGLSGRPVRLRFSLRNGNLYSFQFQPGGTRGQSQSTVPKKR